MKVSLNDQNSEKTELELNPEGERAGRPPVTLMERVSAGADLKKLKKEANANFSLHVLLVMRQDGESLASARFIAWMEGPDGLNRRLAG